MEFVRLTPISLFNIPESLEIKLLTRLCLGLSYLREHIKSNAFFQDAINPLYTINRF